MTKRKKRSAGREAASAAAPRGNAKGSKARADDMAGADPNNSKKHTKPEAGSERTEAGRKGGSDSVLTRTLNKPQAERHIG